MKNKWFIAGLVVILLLLVVLSFMPKKSTDISTQIGKAESSAIQTRQQEISTNPIFQKLPYACPQFTLTFGYSGIVDNKYSLIAYVTVAPGENGDVKIKQQQPNVIKYLQSIGQPANTYIIQYETQSSQ